MSENLTLEISPKIKEDSAEFKSMKDVFKPSNLYDLALMINNIKGGGAINTIPARSN